MADTSKQRLHNTGVSDPDFPDDIYKEIQNTLDTLAQLDQAYRHYRMMLERWSGSTEQKNRLRTELEALYQRDRQPLVMGLADLQERIRRVTSFRTLH